VSEHNKQIVRTFIEEGQNAHSHERCEELTTEDMVLHHPAMREPVRGHGALRELSEGLWESFPDFRFELHELVGEGDCVAARFTVHATNLGPLGPAKQISGRTMAQPSMAVYRLHDGKIAEGWIHEDIYGLLQQLKLIPGTPRTLYWLRRTGMVALLQRMGKLPREPA
jgi:steroid delta-isomerase-like uncharacterized protein